MAKTVCANCGQAAGHSRGCPQRSVCSGCGATEGHYKDCKIIAVREKETYDRARHITGSEIGERRFLEAQEFKKPYESAGRAIGDMLTRMANDVDRFQSVVVELPIPLEPGRLSEERKAFRYKFLQEELDELFSAETAEDEADALVDLIYVAIGALLEMGLNPEAVFKPVQEANMQKLRGETKRGHGYDAVKPEGWTPPNHLAVFEDLAIRAKVSKVFVELTKMRIHKGANYNRGSVKRSDHFPLGDMSYFQMLWVKAVRLRSLVESINTQKSGTALAETSRLIDRELNDLMNYACFWSEYINGISQEDK